MSSVMHTSCAMCVQADEVEDAEAMAADGLTSAEKVPKSLTPILEAQAGVVTLASFSARFCWNCIHSL